MIIDFAILPCHVSYLGEDLIQRTRYKETGLFFINERMQLIGGEFVKALLLACYLFEVVIVPLFMCGWKKIFDPLFCSLNLSLS